MKKWIIFTALLTGCAWAQENLTPSLIVPYKETAQGELRLHIFNPPGHSVDEKIPAIVFFHGGLWKRGRVRQFYFHANYLAQSGMVAICAEYRTEQRHGTDPRACVMDAKSAMRWTRSHAEKLGIDPNRIAAAGGNAGGHLAAATAVLTKFNEPDDDLSISCTPQALVLFNPLVDTSETGYEHERVKDYWQDFSPMHNLDTNTPPTIFFLRPDAECVSAETARTYRDIMKSNGQRCEIMQINRNGPDRGPRGRHGGGPMTKVDDFFANLGWLSEKNRFVILLEN